MADEHNHTEDKIKKSFWDTTIGFITKVAAFLTAITTLVIAIRNFSGDVVQPVMNSTSESGTNDGGKNTKVTDPPASNGTEVSATPPVQTIVEEKSEITFGSFDIQPSKVEIDTDRKPKPITATVEVVNTGNTLMTNCRISIVTDIGNLSGVTTTGYFSLSPEERKTLSIEAGISEPGNITAVLESNNYKVQTIPFTVVVTYKGFMQAKPVIIQ